MTDISLKSIIDTDSHITEPAGIWVDRLPKKYADLAPRVELNPDTGHHHWRVSDHWCMPVGFLSQSGWNEYPPSSPWEYEECDPATYDATARLARLDEYGIDRQILYPNIVGFYAVHLMELGLELATLCVEVYNDWALEWASADHRRLIPMAMLPFWDIDASVREIERCASLGFKGLLFSNCLEKVGLPGFVDPSWDRIYAAAQAADLPVNFHIGFAASEAAERNSADAIAKTRAHAQDVEAQLAAVLSSGTLLMNQSNHIGQIVLSGLCERFPSLKLVSVETGFGHLPFYLETLDWKWKSYGNRSLPLLPSEYFRRQCYATFWFDSGTLPLLELYPENFMFSTDYPHPISLAPGPCAGTDLLPSEWVKEHYSNLDSGLAAKALSGNAAKLYNF